MSGRRCRVEGRGRKGRRLGRGAGRGPSSLYASTGVGWKTARAGLKMDNCSNGGGRSNTSFSAQRESSLVGVREKEGSRLNRPLPLHTAFCSVRARQTSPLQKNLAQSLSIKVNNNSKSFRVSAKAKKGRRRGRKRPLELGGQPAGSPPGLGILPSRATTASLCTHSTYRDRGSSQ